MESGALELAHRRATYDYALAFFDELAAQGVSHVCISPGSRSTPLCLAAAAVERASGGALRTSIHLDERAAGFFALGAAKVLGRPVALVCTSGTAAANYLPAIVEARHASVPLIALTADRPPELRDRGAGQTIDQQRLYGAHALWFHEVAVAESAGPVPRHARTLAARAVACASGPPRGPVHLNWPLREPLEPECAPIAASAIPREPSRSRVALAARAPSPSPAALEWITSLARECERGVLALGPTDRDVARAASRFARAAGWPVLADPASSARAQGDVAVAHSDLFLRDAEFARAHAPEVVVRIGGSPTSKPQRRWLEAQPPRELVLVDPDRAWNDASALATRWLDDDAEALCDAAAAELERAPRARARSWLDAFVRADRAAARAIDRLLSSSSPLGSPGIVRTLAEALPPDVWLYASNSMAVRDVDAYWPLEPRARRILASRGASGIDGVTSSALGAAFASGRRGFLLTGDLAFLHDVGGLVGAASLDLDLTIVVVNDDGGAIFSYLPIAKHGEAVDFERLFRTPHGRDLAHAAALAGALHARVRTRDELRSALDASLRTRGISIVEAMVDPATNLAQHRAIESAVAAELAADARA